MARKGDVAGRTTLCGAPARRASSSCGTCTPLRSRPLERPLGALERSQTSSAQEPNSKWSAVCSIAPDQATCSVKRNGRQLLQRFSQNDLEPPGCTWPAISVGPSAR